MAKENHSGIWVFAEQENGVLHPVTFELLAKAQELKTQTNETVCAVLLGHKVKNLTKQLTAYGADKVLAAEHPELEKYRTRPYQQALTQLSFKYKPSILLFGATDLGRDLAPGMMVSLNTGLTADAVELGYDEEHEFFQTTPAYGGKILARIVIPERRPQMATVRPGIFAPLTPDSSRDESVIFETVRVDPENDYEILSIKEREVSGVPIGQSRVLVAGGRGVGSKEDLLLLQTLAKLIGGRVAGSRPLVDNGLLPHSAQIGQSGSVVKPELIVNVAISGSTQYLTGMQNAGCVISINHTENAPIFDISHYGITADFKKIIPAVIAEIRRRKQGKDSVFKKP